MQMPGRKYNVGSGAYRYGFNGKENDKDISEGDLDFGARIYDNRLGRWLSVDPLSGDFSGFSPYNSMANNPILFIDPDGMTIIINAQSLEELAKVISAIAVNNTTKRQARSITKLHETSKNLKIIAGIGFTTLYSHQGPNDGRIAVNSSTATSYNKGYREAMIFSLGHEIDHAYSDFVGVDFDHVSAEGAGVNTENYLRSVFLGSSEPLRKDYDAAPSSNLWAFLTGNWSESDEKKFKELYLYDDPNPDGEAVILGKTDMRTDGKKDKSATYIIGSTFTYDVNSKDFKDAEKGVTNGVIQYFDYKKDKNSATEKKATIIEYQLANGEEK
jgi:RHS repeat-associated protein